MTPAPPTPTPSEGSIRTPDLSNFREHLSTADIRGRRQWVYAKKPSGAWYRRRTWLSWFLLVIMFAGPFVRINGNPLLMMNVIERRFSILGQIFWPQDAIIFAVAMLLFLTGIIFFTTSFGRLWCGWTCPQTVMMEMVFRKIEYRIEGDAVEQRQLSTMPWTARKLFKRALKLGVFFALSFIVGNTLLAYIIGSDALRVIVTDDPRRHLAGLFFMMLFTLVFFAIFARFREQACTFICPYGRLQSTLLDENTMVVAYDHRRGEKRGKLRGHLPRLQRASAGLGDCIDCLQCVAVCPTGIDIRDGLQMECVHCTACIDACDSVMEHIGAPRGLIRYASFNSIEKREPFRFTARMKAYSLVLAALIALFLTLVLTRPAVEAVVLRVPGALFEQTPDGRIENLYTLRLVNKTSRDLPIELKLEQPAGSLSVMGATNLNVPAAKLTETSVLIELEPSVLTGAATKIRIGVYSGGKLLHHINTGFIGPRSH
jgi:cytochrome c oxidase accessory protein FixG